MASQTLTVAILIPPQAQSLDISGPLSVFREASQCSQGMISCQKPSQERYRVKLISMVESKKIEINGMTILADASIYDSRFSIDTLLVAGTDQYSQVSNMLDVKTWLQRRVKGFRRYGSICTGAFFLGEAGLLDKKQVATHWEQTTVLAENYPQANVLQDAIYVQDGALNTSAGITAGIDLSLKLVEDDYGRDLALCVARKLVVFLRRPGGQSQFSAHLEAQFAEDDTIQSIQQWILDNLDTDLSLPALAGKAAMSVRNFSRVFRAETSKTPADFVELSRVDAAKRLLEDSDLHMKRIATRCGFTNVDLMRRAFLRRIDVTPSAYRRRFSRSLIP